ncbi:MAG: hypothetical protein AAF915_08435 [Cyanobacteria bacterium P01_D01_bin.50]
MRLPYWLPNFRSWFNAVALTLLMIGITYAMDYFLKNIGDLLNLAPWLSGAIVFLLFLFPIVAIAFLHNWLHTFLDMFFPESRIPEDQVQTGWFPSLVSWWEGIYGWTVNVLSSLFTFYLLGVFFISPYSSTLLTILDENLSRCNFSLPSVRFTILQIIVAAYLYQLEYLVKQRFFAAARR